MSRPSGNSERGAVSGGSDRVSESKAANPSVSQSINRADSQRLFGANSAAHDTVAKSFDQRADGSSHPFQIADASKAKGKSPEKGASAKPADTKPAAGKGEEDGPTKNPNSDKAWEREGRNPTEDEIVKALTGKK